MFSRAGANSQFCGAGPAHLWLQPHSRVPSIPLQVHSLCSPQQRSPKHAQRAGALALVLTGPSLPFRLPAPHLRITHCDASWVCCGEPMFDGMHLGRPQCNSGLRAPLQVQKQCPLCLRIRCWSAKPVMPRHLCKGMDRWNSYVRRRVRVTSFVDTANCGASPHALASASIPLLCTHRSEKVAMNSGMRVVAFASRPCASLCDDIQSRLWQRSNSHGEAFASRGRLREPPRGIHRRQPQSRYVHYSGHLKTIYLIYVIVVISNSTSLSVVCPKPRKCRHKLSSEKQSCVVCIVTRNQLEHS